MDELMERLTTPYRHPDAGTTALDSKFEEIVIIGDREFQRYAVDHDIYFGPVDDVGRRWLPDRPTCVVSPFESGGGRPARASTARL